MIWEQVTLTGPVGHFLETRSWEDDLDRSPTAWAFSPKGRYHHQAALGGNPIDTGLLSWYISQVMNQLTAPPQLTGGSVRDR